MEYIVLRVKGKQYLVSKGDSFLVDKFSNKDKIEVLLKVKDVKVNVGRPVLDKGVLKIDIQNELEKGKKIHVFKYKAKSRYRKKIGFRPVYTKLQIKDF